VDARLDEREREVNGGGAGQLVRVPRENLEREIKRGEREKPLVWK